MKTDVIKSNPAASLSDARVRKIKRWLRHGDVINLAALARRFKVPREVVSRIRDGITYRHVAIDGDDE
jgi:hypothetical protein